MTPSPTPDSNAEPNAPQPPPAPVAPIESSAPLEEQLPPEVTATPTEVKLHPDEPLTWWRPGWQDIFAAVGWRWILLTPAAGLLILAILFVIARELRPVIVVFGAKLLIFVGAVAISLVAYVARRIARARTEPFCIHCGYNLTGLPDNYRCPECGHPYTWSLIAEYRRDPQWFVERYRAQHSLPPAEVPFLARKSRRRRNRDGTS